MHAEQVSRLSIAIIAELLLSGDTIIIQVTKVGA